MKKILILLLLFCSFSYIEANATNNYPIGRESDGAIIFPDEILESTGKIKVDSSITDFTMHYQFIEITEGQKEDLLAGYEVYTNYVLESNNKTAELMEILDDKKAKYETLKASETASDEEIEKSYQDYILAQTTFDNYKKSSFDTSQELYEDYLSYLPLPNESKWNKSNNTEYSINLKNFDGIKYYIFWVKLDIKDEESIGDYCMVSVEGSLWKDFVENFKKGELFTNTKKNYYTITNTDSQLKIDYKDDVNELTTIFNYEQGILTYKVNDDEKTALVDGLLIYQTVKALADLKGYNIDELSKWLEEQDESKLTLATHGIEFTLAKYEYEDENSTISGDRFTKFRIDIANGIKYTKVNTTEDKPSVNTSKDSTVENPKTGLATYTIVILGIASLAGGMVYYLKRKNIIKKI